MFRDSNKSRRHTPDLSQPPVNVVEPLKWILARINNIKHRKESEAAIATKQDLVRRAVEMALAALRPNPTAAKVKIAMNVLRALPGP